MARFVRGRTYYLRYYVDQQWVAVPAVFKYGYNQYSYMFHCPHGRPLWRHETRSSLTDWIDINPDHQLVMETPRNLPVWPYATYTAQIQHRARQAYDQGLLTL